MATPLDDLPRTDRLRRVSPKVLLIAGAVMLFVAAVVIALVRSPDPSPTAGMITIEGSLALQDGYTEYAGNICTGRGGYSDIRQGTQVTVYTGAEVVGLGALKMGDETDSQCIFAFTVEVPAGHDFYAVEVSHRGRMNYPATKLTDPIWLTLG